MQYVVVLVIILGILYGVYLLLKYILVTAFTFIVSHLCFFIAAFTVITLTILAVIFYKKAINAIAKYNSQCTFSSSYKPRNKYFDFICKFRNK